MPTVNRATTTTRKSTNPAGDARAWAQAFNFQSASAVKKVQVARTKAPATGPLELQRAFKFYRSWQDRDLGNVRLLKTTPPGYALHTTTDGDLGFLELYSDKGTLLASGTTGVDAQGRSTVSWDPVLGAVREKVAPKNASPTVRDFHKAIARADNKTSPSGEKISVGELRAAAKGLVGTELTASSVDSREKAGLLRVLAGSKFTPGSRAYGEQLAELYTPAANTTLTGYAVKDLAGAPNARLAQAKVNASGSPPKLNTMVALARRAFDLSPAQLAPVTRTEAAAALKTAGFSASAAKAAVEQLADAKGQLYAGRFFDSDQVAPQPMGIALFGVASSGRELKAINAPTAPPPVVGPQPREVISRLLGVDRAVELAAQRQTATGTQFDLVWRPPTGGQITARLDVPRDGSEATVSGLTLPPAVGMAETSLADRISQATGAPQQGLAYAQSGNDWLVAHRPAAGGPVTLSLVKVAVGGATASVAPANLGAGQVELGRMLALGLARVHAETLVDDPAIGDDARLEVALRTRWAAVGQLQSVPPDDSAVGFDPATERAQFMLPRVWGDNAVFVTFPKSGAVRVEDFN